MSGPFETQRQAADSVRHIIDSPPGTGAWQDGCLRLLEDACRAAGAQLGAYDSQVLVWLAGWEPWTCAVIAGLITRAHAGVLDDDDRRTVLDALDVAADHKRDMAASAPTRSLPSSPGRRESERWPRRMTARPLPAGCEDTWPTAPRSYPAASCSGPKKALESGR